MRQILLPFGADTSNDVPIAAAGHLAARTNASITAMFYPRLPDPVIVDPMSGGVVSYDGLDDEIEAQKSAAEKNIVCAIFTQRQAPPGNTLGDLGGST